MQGRESGPRAAGTRGCSSHHGACRLRAECTGLCQLPDRQLRASAARNARRPRPRPPCQATPLALPHPLPGPAPPPPTPSCPRHPKGEEHRGPATETRVGGSWGSCGSGENAAVTAPTAWVTLPQAAAGTPQPSDLTTRLSSGSSCEGKCQGGFLQAPVQLERIPCPLMAIITNIWGS